MSTQGLTFSAAVVLLLLDIAPVRGRDTYDPGDRPAGYADFKWELPSRETKSPEPPPPAVARPATISTDVLRHPPSLKARRLLQKAIHLSELGNYPAAIQGFQEALAKEPSAAPYAHNLLGLEYLRISEFAKAKDSFEEAVRLMPRESINHANLALTLAWVGDWESAEREVHEALNLDHANSRAKSIQGLITARMEVPRE
jgi:tetratricopeptide (TPR) repeat protein